MPRPSSDKILCYTFSRALIGSAHLKSENFMADFVVPKRCTIASVNAALVAAGYGDIEIIYDDDNWQRVKVEHLCYDQHGDGYILSERTNFKTARQWAQQFAEGRYK